MFWESVLIAWDALIGNKLRSMLTMLGIIIGVGAVITMISIGMGAREQVSSQIASLGSNLIIVMPGATSPNGMRLAAGSNTSLTYEDAQAIAKQVENVNLVAPSVSRQFQVVAENKNWVTSVQGTTPEFQDVRNFHIARGSFFTQQDQNTRARVVVLGKTAADNLFGELEPVGRTVRIGKAPFQVVGVLESKGQSTMGMDQDDIVVVPITTAQERLLGITYIHNASIQASDADSLQQVQDDVAILLRKRHHLQNGAEDDFSIRSLSSIQETAAAATSTITVLLGSIAAISLLVGGIGIMNIMLVSVTERTREIGIRKALGARNHDIMLQFLIESVVISVSGGALGVALAVAAAWVISHVAGWSTLISLAAVSVSVLFALLIGLFFGIYPAQKAARLDPIEALRYE